MNVVYRLSSKLNALTIFRNILADEVISSFRDLSSALSSQLQIDKVLEAYGAFTSTLFKHNPCFSDYVKELVINDENFYIIGKGQNKIFDNVIEASLVNELTVLEDLSKLTSYEVKSLIKYDDFLPDWTNSSLDLTTLYTNHIKNVFTEGYGLFAKYNAFVLSGKEIVPIKNPDPQRLSELPGYERERELVVKNTLSLIHGKGANNVLLYGDAGTGKSSTIKAILNEYKGLGLRLIEIKKDQLMMLPDLLEKLSDNPLKFILFIDDLSFNGNDECFTALKAVLEGSIACRTENIALYATSNRKHLIKENMSDRDGDDLHFNDTIQENLSLSARFGLTVTFQTPGKDGYLDIVKHLAVEKQLNLSDEELFVRAEAFAIRNGGRSPRTAKHFIQVETVSKWAN